MYKTNDKSEASKELERICQSIEQSYSNFNTLRTIPTLLALEDTVGTLAVKYVRTKETEDDYIASMQKGVFNFILEWNQFLSRMLYNILNKGYIDCSTKILDTGLNMAVSVGGDYISDFRCFIRQLQEDKLLGKNYITRTQERNFLNCHPGAMLIILDSTIDKKVVQTLDKILALRQLMYKEGLLKTMIFSTPKGTEIEFNKDGTFIKPENDLTFESLREKSGLSHKLIEGSTHITYWNSNLLNQVKKTLKTIDAGKSTDNLANIILEQKEKYLAYSSLSGFCEIFKNTYGLGLDVFFDIINDFIIDCYPNDNTLGIWRFSTLKKSNLTKKHSIDDINLVISILSNQNKDNGFYGFIVVDDLIFSNFGRLASSTLYSLDNCFNDLYENDLKGKSFEEATRRSLKEKGLIVLPKSIEIFEPMLPEELAIKLWGKQKHRTDLDVVAFKENAILFIECKDAKFHSSFLNKGNRFRNFVIEQYYRVKWINENFSKFVTYVQNDCMSLGIDLTKDFFLFPLVVSNILVNIDNFEGAPLINFSELEKIISKEWKIDANDPSKELVIRVDGRLYNLPWFINEN